MNEGSNVEKEPTITRSLSYQTKGCIKYKIVALSLIFCTFDHCLAIVVFSLVSPWGNHMFKKIASLWFLKWIFDVSCRLIQHLGKLCEPLDCSSSYKCYCTLRGRRPTGWKEALIGCGLEDMDLAVINDKREYNFLTGETKLMLKVSRSVTQNLPCTSNLLFKTLTPSPKKESNF